MSVNSTQRSLLANYILGQGSSSTQGKNYVKNSFAMNGTTNVAVSGTATVAKNTTTPLTGISDFLVTLPNNTTDYVEWSLDTLDNSLTNQNCQLTFDYKIGSLGSAVEAQVLINGVLTGSQVISTTPSQYQLSLNVLCGDLTNSTTVRISNASGNSGTSSINIANVNYGKATNIGTVAQAVLFGVVKITGCTAQWQKVAAGSTLTGYTAQTSCSYATEGKAVADTTFGSTQLPAIKFSSMPVGDYRIEYEGTIGANGTSGTIQTNQFTDGTTTAREISTLMEGPAATGGYPGISQSFSYTAPKSNVTWQLFSAVNDANNTQVFGTTAKPGVIKVWYFPSSSQQAVTPEQQKAPTIRTFTSGSGTYTRPNGVTYIKVRMVGGGGAGSFNAIVGTAGGDSTFGTSLLTAGGGGAATAGTAQRGGLGGTSTINSPAVGTLYAGNGGGGGLNTSSGLAGFGGGSFMGGGARSGIAGANASAGVNGTGGGGSGNSNVTNSGSGGGGAGGLEAIITNPSLTYSYSVGAGGTGGAAVGGSGIIIVEEYYSQSAPILVGSVTSNSSGAERIERAYITKSGACTISTQSGSWLTSATANGTGRCDLVWPVSTFSAAPSCITTNAGTGTRLASTNPTSTTGVSVFMTNPNSLEDNNFNIICIGPR